MEFGEKYSDILSIVEKYLNIRKFKVLTILLNLLSHFKI